MSGIMLASVGNSYGSAPVNTVAPAVTGTATFGQTLTTTNGTWIGAPAPTFTYQWFRSPSTSISGATSTTYVLVAGDVGFGIFCQVRATNAVAPSGVTANSNTTANVAATVPGAPTIGTATGTGVNTATVSFTAPANNGGSTITQYTAVSSPGGITASISQSGSGTINFSGLSAATSYTFTVTATNSAGTSAASAASNSTSTFDAPGSITYANGYSGPSYQPIGYPTVTVTLYGGGGTNTRSTTSFSAYGLGSVTTKTGVPANSLFIRCPSGVNTSQWSGGGSGGIGEVAYASPSFNGGYGGAVCAATWSGGVMVAAGGGGNASSNSVGRRGQSEGLTATNATNSASGSNGGNGAPTAPCYYGGGGGGGGYSAGGNGGQTNSGGNPGGNGASPSPTGTGSYGYSSITTNANQGLGYAVVSWS